VVKHDRACHYFLCSISFDLVMRFASAPGRDRGVGLGLSGSPTGRSPPASRSGVISSIDAAAFLLLMISVNRMLGHIEHRRPPQVRGWRERGWTAQRCRHCRHCGAEQVLDFLVSIEPSLQVPFRKTPTQRSIWNLHLLWVDGWWYRESRKVGGPSRGRAYS
jgi:hypothetical protein